MGSYKKNPFKRKVFFSLKKRLYESKKISKGNKKIKVIYLDKKIRSSRTINVIEYLRKINKANKIYLLIGSDNLVSFHKWKDYEKIIDFCHIVVFSRKGYDKMARKSAIKAVSNADVICETDENNIIDCMSSLKKKKIKLNPVKFTEKQKQFLKLSTVIKFSFFSK